MIRQAALTLLILLTVISFPCGAAAESEAARLYSLGRNELKQGNGRGAIDFFTQAIALEPDNHRYYNDRGIAYKRLGQIDKALADYSIALEKKPDYGNALNNRGVANLSKGSLDNAIRDFTLALRFKGHKGRVYTNRGIAFAEKGNHDRAIQDFEKAVAIPPLDSRAFFYLAESLFKTGKALEALKVYRLTSNMTKNPAIVSYVRGQISRLEQQTAPEPAKKKKTKSVSGDPALRACPIVEEEVPAKAQPNRRMRAREIRATAPRSVPNRTIIKQEVGTPRIAVKSLKDMDYRSRMKALSGFSSNSADIFRQGRRFQEDSDTRKALVRYEDALHLERRKKNRFGVAWCLLEIGRIHSKLGNHLRAARIQAKTLKFFESLKADDEIILTLVELGNINSSLGKHEQAAAHFAQATARAESNAYAELRTSIEDLAKKNSQAAALRKKRAAVLAASSKEPQAVAGSEQKEIKKSKPRRVKIKKSKKTKKRKIKNQSARYLALLRKYYKTNDRQRMIPVLEKLGAEYEKTEDYKNVVHSLSVSLAYREELGGVKGISEPLARLAGALERLGRDAEALESYVRALTLTDEGDKTAKPKQLRSKAKASAKRLAVEPEATISALEALWKARASGDRAAETRALQKVGVLYEHAGNHSRALKYFERATASMLLQKARSQDNLGDVYAAEKSLEKALEILKELDYPLYLNVKNRKRTTSTAVQQSALINNN